MVAMGTGAVATGVAEGPGVGVDVAVGVEMMFSIGVGMTCGGVAFPPGTWVGSSRQATRKVNAARIPSRMILLFSNGILRQPYRCSRRADDCVAPSGILCWERLGRYPAQLFQPKELSPWQDPRKRIP